MDTREQRSYHDDWQTPTPAGRAAKLADVFADRYCREAVAHLRTADRPVRTAELARAVAAAIRDEPPDEVPDEVQRRIQTMLHFGHLPALDEHGIVSFDPDENRVRLARDVD